jgi:hypothetical protein
VPPSPFPATPPPLPEVTNDFARAMASSDPAERRRAEEEANGSPAFQAELQRLSELLPRAEPDNFVAVRIVRDPGVAGEVWFKRDAAATLERYSSDPLFRPRQGGSTPAEQERLRALWTERIQDSNLISTLSVDPFTGTVELGVAVEEAEFRRIAAQRGWDLGAPLVLTFPPPRPEAFAVTSLAPLVRVFAREDKHSGIRLLALSTGRIVLEDGCFRLAREHGRDERALVMFARDSQLGRDAQGYLAITQSGANLYRIGEMGAWGGPNGVDEKEPDVRRLRQRCGDGPIVNVANPQSERLFGLPDARWVADYARANSLTYEAAWQRVIGCMERQEAAGNRGLGARDRCIRQFN